MKNACIVLKNERNALLSKNDLALIETFVSHGYAFEEIRILLQTDARKVCETVATLQKESENVAVICEKIDLLQAQTYIKNTLDGVLYQGGRFGEGIYNMATGTCFLLASDDAETGNDCAAKVCIPYLNRKYGMRADKYVVCAVGAKEEHVKRMLQEAKNCSGGKIGFRHVRQYGEDRIEMFYDGNTPKMLVDDVIRIFAEGLEECIYALGEDIALEEQLVRLLRLRGKKLSVTESFTGGGVGRRIVSVSGASDVYFEGLNTYAGESKMKRLGVLEYTLKTLGAVSDQTAYEMATGLLKTGDCDISIATTGLAGPKSDNSLLPVGLCYIAIGMKERVFVYRYVFEGNRETITETGINYALFHAYKQLKNL
ncbi:MAG: CinA family protein [Clostridia bacterium]|nr:CinA family protein [Clostridia bacterium]